MQLVHVLPELIDVEGALVFHVKVGILLMQIFLEHLGHHLFYEELLCVGLILLEPILLKMLFW